MHRNQLKNLLTNYMPTDPAEQHYKTTILDFVNNQPNCFERTLEIGHITASCWLLNQTGDKALLMHHTKLNMWVQLGGHCDGDSNVLAVALKEAQEESGMENIVAVNAEIFDIDVHLIPESKKEKAHYHYDIRFLLKVDGPAEIVQNHESKELRWMSKNRSELPTNERSVTRMFDKWVNLK